jgi:methylenetetrahydrofolate dehydrogenase (NADP+)/methenyltetrahydrofolate cyclohydrolase
LEIYDCKLLYHKLLRRCEKELAQVKKRINPKLHLGIITLTTDEQNVAFASKVQSVASRLGIEVEEERVAARNIGRKFMPVLREWAEDEDVHGVLLLYEPGDNMPPLSDVWIILPWDKDVYGGHFYNIGHYCIESKPRSDQPQPVEVAAVVEIIKHYQIPAKKKRVVIVGEGKSFDRILMQKLCNMGCDVCYRQPEPEPTGVKSAPIRSGRTRTTPVNSNGEIVVSCVNRAGYLSKSRLHRNSIVIDNGHNFFRGRIGGDVDFNSVQNWVKAITPVPGGVKSIAHLIALTNFTRVVKRRFGLTEEDKKKDQLTRRFHQSDKKLEANRERV